MDFLKQRKINIVDNCPKCHGKDITCNCYRTYSLDFKKFEAHIPFMFFDADYKLTSKILTPNQKNICDTFLNNKIQGLYLENGLKSSRTELMCSILIEVLKKNQTCQFIDPMACMQIGMSQLYDSKTTEYNKLISSDILAFNDVGDERKLESQAVEDVFDNILRERLFAMKQIIITSSYTIEKFTSIYTKGRQDLIAKSFKVISLPTIDINDIFKDIRN